MKKRSKKKKKKNNNNNNNKEIKVLLNIQPNKYYISWGKPPEQVASRPVQKPAAGPRRSHDRN